MAHRKSHKVRARGKHRRASSSATTTHRVRRGPHPMAFGGARSREAARHRSASLSGRYHQAKREYHALGLHMFKTKHHGRTPSQEASHQRRLRHGR